MNSVNKNTKSVFTFDKAVGNNNIVNITSGDVARQAKLHFDDTPFFYREVGKNSSTIADLVDIACAIYVADRCSPQSLEKPIREIYIDLPLRNPDYFKGELIHKLQSTLEWVSATKWKFNLVQRKVNLRKSESVIPLFPALEEGSHVMLWSGGLDALAGLYSQLNEDNKNSIVLLGVGGNNRILGRQKKLAKILKNDYKQILFYPIPIRLRSKELRKNKLMRVRGVVFMLLGAVASILMKSNKLYIYENGIGALNLPYIKSSVGLDHVRSVHPFTLDKVSDFLSCLIDKEFKIINPSIFNTKAQMCQELASDNRLDLPPLTESCDSIHRKEISQCGYCSSCLLRRQALLAIGLHDKTKYVVTHGDLPAQDPSIPLRAMLSQVNEFKRVFECEDYLQWQALTGLYPELDDIADRYVEITNSLDARQSILNLYKEYTKEWISVKNHLFKGIMDWPNT